MDKFVLEIQFLTILDVCVNRVCILNTSFCRTTTGPSMLSLLFSSRCEPVNKVFAPRSFCRGCHLGRDRLRAGRRRQHLGLSHPDCKATQERKQGGEPKERRRERKAKKYDQKLLKRLNVGFWANVSTKYRKLGNICGTLEAESAKEIDVFPVGICT